MSQEQQAKIVRALASRMLAPVREFQQSLTDPGRDALLTILDAYAWCVAITIARLPASTRIRLRDYVVSRMDEGIAALKDTPVPVRVDEKGEPV